MNKLVKSLLLAAPATLVAAAAAQAADLPANKSAPVTYVKVCDAYGSGFFYIPGTDTCLHVGGYARFETRYTAGQNIINPGAAGTAASPFVSQIAAAQDQTGMQVRGRVDLDARNQTQWGTLQEVVRIRAADSAGAYATAGTGNFGTAATPAPNGSNGSITMERAYFRFAGLTAGVAEENFSTIPAYMYGPTEYPGFPNGMPQIAYTATFGGGFSATLAAEQKNQFGSTTSVAAGAGGGAFSTLTTSQQNDAFTGAALVGNVRYDASWGFFQVAGAIDDNQYNTASLATATTSPSVYNPLVSDTHHTGYAIGFSFRVNLPMLAAGDQINFQTQYARGFTGLLKSSGTMNDQSDSSGTSRFLGGVQFSPVPYIVTSATGTTDTVGAVSGYSMFGIFTHYWSPTWRSNFDLGYTKINNPTAAASAGVQDGNLAYIGTAANLIWTPVKNFDIGLELDYAHLSAKLQNPSAAYVAAGSPGLAEGNWSTILRIERQF